MELKLRDIVEFPGVLNEQPDYQRFVEYRQLIDVAFRAMAIHETSEIDAFVLRMLEAKIAEVKTRHPALSDTDAYIVAGRLLKQLIACYQGALGQLLP